MMKNNVNYMCVKDCGHYDPHTKTVSKLDKPMKLNLLSSRKNKRDIIGQKESENVINNQVYMLNDKNTKKHYNRSDSAKNIDAEKIQFLSFNVPKTTTESNCKKIKRDEEFYEEDYFN